ncbi:uncharacterized protein [Procambarus clarkii]|uniref:uncharacterized protein isoform X2 n=1 Tax=Procambarus clarkii TaxID=6728 RepID=UPI001E676E9E|nr:uncharacterized protein LOC123757613 isoform X2 [Procambarus clarkii]
MSEQVVREIFNKLDKTSTFVVKQYLMVWYDRKNDLFVLKWMENMKLDFADKEGFLKAQRLQNKVFAELRSLVESIEVPGAKVRITETTSALTVNINHKSHRILIHLTPMIPAQLWGSCPRLAPLEELPETFQQYLEALNCNASPIMFFTLSVPQRQMYDHGHRLVDVNLSFLENQFIAQNSHLRDMVRLLKLVVNRCDWHSKYHLCISHLHHLAIKYADHLQDKTIWDGYSTLLKHLYNELGDWNLHNLFFRNRQCILDSSSGSQTHLDSNIVIHTNTPADSNTHPDASAVTHTHLSINPHTDPDATTVTCIHTIKGSIICTQAPNDSYTNPYRPTSFHIRPLTPTDFQDSIAIVMDYRSCKVRNLV